MEQHREPRNKPTPFQTEEANTYNGLKIVYSIRGAGKIGQTVQKNETRPPSYATCKGQIQNGLKT